MTTATRAPSASGDEWDALVASARERAAADATALWQRAKERARGLAAAAAVLQSPDFVNASVAAAEQVIEAADTTPPELVVEALARAAPGVELSAVQQLDGEALQGMAVLVRGSYGELGVLAMLQQGDLPLPEGTVHAQLADFTQPGYDLVFEDASGDIVEATANVKVASSATAITDHFATHPDVAIVYASSDAVADLGPEHGINVVSGHEAFSVHGPTVVDIGVEADELSEVVTAGIDLTDFDLGGDALNALPIFAFGLIGFRGLMQWVMTDEPNSVIVSNVASQGKNVMINSGAGALAAMLTGTDLIAAPITFGTAISRSIVGSAHDSARRSEEAVAKVRSHLGRIRR